MIRDAFKTFVHGTSFLVRTLRWLAIAVAVYAFLGFIVAPWIVKWQLAKALTRQLARDVTIEKLSINPFALSVRVQGFLMKEPSGNEPAVRFDELYLNLSSSSIFRLAPVLDEIRLVRPAVRIVRNADKSYNYTDLIEKFTANPGPRDTASATPPRFSLNNIEIVDGRIDFDDRPDGKQHTVSEIRLGIPFISDLPYATDINVQPVFSARVNGAPFALKGETKPFKDTRETTLELVLDGLDLTRYADYSPVPLGFRVQHGLLDTRLTLSLTTQGGLLDTLMISGNAEIGKLQLADKDGEGLVGFDSLESEARFTLTRRGTTQEMIVSGVSATLRDLRVEDATRRSPLVEVNEIKLAEAGADLGTRNLEIGELTIDRASLQLARYRDGTFSFKHLIEDKGTEAPGNKKTAEAPWTATLKHLKVNDANAIFNDQLPATSVKLALTAIGVEAENLSTAANTRGNVRANTVLNKRGRIEATGALGLNPPGGELNVVLKDIGLTPFQPYIEDNINIVITQGAVSSRGQVVFSSSDSGPLKTAFRGNISVHSFVSLDKPTDQELLKWRTLSLDGLDFGSMPLKLGVKEISLDDFYSRLIVNSDGTLNLQMLMRKPAAPPEPANTEKQTPVTKAAAGVPSSNPAPEIHIGEITFARGNVNYSDHFVKPNVTANLTSIDGGVSEMTADTVGDVKLSGSVNGMAPFDIAGRINPFAKDLFLNLTVNARDIELSPMSPYTIKYASYGIEKGKLSLRLKYLVEHGKLTAENNINLDQLTFGDKVESPTAMNLPVLLAVSLLKDRNGVINVSLPVSGSLNDPKFSIGRVILQVLGNLIMKAVTSPFALLGAAFGGGEELAFVEFAPGRATLTPGAEAKLKTLAKALSDRPALKMDIAGRADPEVDREGLKHVSIERKIKTQKLQATNGTGTPSDPADDVVVEPGEYEKYLTAAYKAEKFTKPRNYLGFAKSLPVPEMEQLMLANARVSDEDLRLLANQRAQTVKDWLMKTGQVPAERLFLTSSHVGSEGPKDKSTAMRVDFALK